MGDTSDSNKTDPNTQDDLGLSQFSPAVLEFMLGVVLARKGKQANATIPESADAFAPP